MSDEPCEGFEIAIEMQRYGGADPEASRRPAVEPLVMEPASESRDPALDRERSRQIRQALSRLSFEHRTVLALFSLDGLTHREIAETLGIPEGTVWSRLHRARKKLAVELDALGFQRS